jgi:RecB family endonuclease NucS
LKDENGKTRTKRPDRVMLNEQEVIVVDYKFGEEKHEHSQQLKQYKDLMRKMGYKNVKGYLWYVPREMLVEV